MQNYFRHRADRLDVSPPIAYDSTTISTYSRNQIDTRQGFNKVADGLNTVKLLTLYSVDTNQPIAFTKQPGNLPDVTNLRNALREWIFSLKNPLVVTDNGYYSQSNLTDLTQSNTKFLTLGNIDIAWIHHELETHREELETISGVCLWDWSIHGITVYKSLVSLGITRLLRALRNVMKSIPGGGGGFRTRVQKSSTDSSTYLALSFDLTWLTRTRTLQPDELPFV